MYQLSPITEQTIDSREVARMTDKTHPHLLRDIDGYYEAISTNPNLDPLDFFIKSSYIDAKGESRKCYLCTRKGCEMIANKMTGTKGIQFTAQYINLFHKMEKTLKSPALPDSSINERLLGRANSAARNVRITFKEAGVNPQQTAIAVTQIYHQIGLQIPLNGLSAPRKTYDQTAIAKKLGVLSASGKPHAQAIGAIISKIEITEDEKELVPFNRNGHADQAYQYAETVIEKISKWLKSNEYPNKIQGPGKAFGVQYSRAN